jgi:hypothetical protein
MEQKFIINKNQLEAVFAIVTRSTEIIPGLTVADYIGIAKALQNLPEFELDEDSKE